MKLFLQCLPKVPVSKWKFWHMSLYLTEAKRFPVRYTPYSPLKFLPMHHMAVSIMCFSYVMISQR